MKKEYRIRKNQEFQEIIRLKQSQANAKFVVYFRKNDNHLKVGISVSKKLGNAVIRNQIKRQVRMMAQQVFDKEQKLDIIVIVRNKYLKSSFADNKKDLEYIYNKINKRKD